MARFLLALAFFFLPASVMASDPLDFTVHKFGNGLPVVLVVGGIQGDEPGGFSAATLLATQYTFTKGSVWVVPNLNFPSIIERSRGLHGDMNRKFATLSEKDPQFATVRRIQALVSDPQVDLVLNLHDGSGFYRPKYEDKLRNPNRWGQAVIIDMERMDGPSLGAFDEHARRVVAEVNGNLLQDHHRYHVKNTHTDQGDPEMEKCLTWFAINHGKPAYGLEVSKEFTTEGRTYYHLHAIEAFLRLAGVEFERSFPLTFKGVRLALQSDISVAFGGERVRLPLENVRPRLSGYIPVPRDLYNDFSASKPILAVLGDQKELRVHYGNRVLTKFRPEWHDALSDVPAFQVLVDGTTRTVRPGDVVDVREHFQVQGREGYRIRAIGTGGARDESGKKIIKKHFRPEYSVDVGMSTFRVEAYQDKDFAGMFLVRFGNSKDGSSRKAMPGRPGPESELGR